MNAFGQATDTDRIHKRWFNKSLGLVHIGKDTKALRVLDKGLNLNPREKEAQSQRALIVRKMGRLMIRDSRSLVLCSILVFQPFHCLELVFSHYLKANTNPLIKNYI